MDIAPSRNFFSLPIPHTERKFTTFSVCPIGDERAKTTIAVNLLSESRRVVSVKWPSSTRESINEAPRCRPGQDGQARWKHPLPRRGADVRAVRCSSQRCNNRWNMKSPPSLTIYHSSSVFFSYLFTFFYTFLLSLVVCVFALFECNPSATDLRLSLSVNYNGYDCSSPCAEYQYSVGLHGLLRARFTFFLPRLALFFSTKNKKTFYLVEKIKNNRLSYKIDTSTLRYTKSKPLIIRTIIRPYIFPPFLPDSCVCVSFNG